MKINGSDHHIDAYQNVNLDKANLAHKPTAQREGGRSSDRIELSGKSQQVERLKKVVQEAPDIRADKVNEIRRQLEAGTYEVSAKDIAEKIIGG